MPKTALIEKKDHVAVITLNRPDRMNAFNEEQYVDYDACLTDAARDREIRAVIVTGAGKAFCTGLDVSVLGGLGGALPGETADKMVRGEADLVTVVQKMRDMPKPIIGAVNGFAVGGGFGIALACDIRIAAEEAKFGMVYAKRGISPDCGTSFFLPKVVGSAKALEMVWTGENIDAREAEKLGIVSKVVPQSNLLAAARELAGKIALSPPLAVQWSKSIIYKGLEETDLRTHMDYELYRMFLLFGTEDFREGVKSFQEKRPPVFKGK